MNTVGERLRYYIENQHGNVKSFADKYGIHYPGLTSILNNKRTLGMEVLLQVKNGLPNLDTEWLLFGNRNPSITIDGNDVKELKEPSEVYKVPDAFEEMLLKYLGRQKIQEKLNEILKNNNQ